jgi:hypothetical protein
MTNRWDRSQTNDESESSLSNTLPGHRASSPSLLTLMGPIPKSAAGFIIPPLVLRSSATSDMSASSSRQLPEGKDHTGVVVVLPVFWLVSALQVGEVPVSVGGLQMVAGLYPLFACPFD